MANFISTNKTKTIMRLCLLPEPPTGGGSQNTQIETTVNRKGGGKRLSAPPQR